MIEQEFGPIYEAMGASSATVAWLEKQERERSDWDMHWHLSKLGAALQNLFDTKPVPTVVPPTPRIDFVICCLKVVTSLTCSVIRNTTNNLPNITESFRQPIALLLVRLEEMVIGIEELTDTWEIQLNSELSERIGSAIRQIDPARETIMDWRESLELVSD
jgi:hypothetical protein